MRFEIVKCHGSGNDFPLIDARGHALADADWAVVARALADRGGPVGGDGLLLLREGDGGAFVGFAMFNSDGSEAETCLNGVRCVARVAFERLGVREGTMRLKTSRVGVAAAAAIAPGVVTVRETAAPASLDVAAWPMIGAGARVIEAAVPMLGSARLFTAVAMPNPHLVAFVEAVDEGELVALWRQCEAAPAWLPNRANISFVEVRGADTLFVRTAERGVGLTDSCGSAMAASTYAACLTRRVAWDAGVTVLNRGGYVRASAAEDARVTIEGNATVEWEGSVEVELETGRAGGLEVVRRHPEEVAAWEAVRAIAAPRTR